MERGTLGDMAYFSDLTKIVVPMATVSKTVKILYKQTARQTLILHFSIYLIYIYCLNHLATAFKTVLP